jgi:transposase
MQLLVERIAGIDIGKAGLTCCVRIPDPGRAGRRKQVIRSYTTMSAQLRRLADWLTENQVTRVIMEGTSDYWKPVFYLLEAAGFDVWLVNAHQVKGVPGRRKTDAIDAAWLAQIGECELVSPSFVPPPPIRRLRDLTRYRTVLVREHTRQVQRLEKLLEDAGIKLSVVASSIAGASARAMICALIAGQRDPLALADLAKGKLKRKRADLIEALTGQFDEHHAFLCQQMLTHLDQLQAQISQLDQRINTELEPYRAQAAQLDTIYGIADTAAARLIAEIGVDMSIFPTAQHLTSWARTAPRTRQSGATTTTATTGKGNPWLAEVLGEIATAIARSPTYLGTRHRRLAARRGKLRAIVATSRHILTITWHLLSDPTHTTVFHDLGPDYHLTRTNTTQRTRQLVRQLQALGHHVTLHPTQPPPATTPA